MHDTMTAGGSLGRRDTKVQRRQDDLELSTRSLSGTEGQPRLIVDRRSTESSQSRGGLGDEGLSGVIEQGELEHVLRGVSDRDVEGLIPDGGRAL